MASFSASQSAALEAIVGARRNVFLSGAGGTGKSHVVHEAVKRLTAAGGVVAVTATTGVAALAICGKTLFSLLRLTPRDMDAPPEELGARAAKNRSLCAALRALTTLVVDEVSMMHVDLFVRADAVLRAARRSNAPFGGLHTLLVGDFFQLPPVTRDGSIAFIFLHPLFFALVAESHELKEAWRQVDPAFVGLLARMRRGELNAEDVGTLQGRVGATLPAALGIVPTKLYSRNVDVDGENEAELARIDGAATAFKPRSGTHACRGMSVVHSTALLAQTVALGEKLCKDLGVAPVALKVGAQVVLTYNLDGSGGLCNGSRGVVLGYAAASAEDGSPEAAFHGRTREGATLYPAAERLPIVRFNTPRGPRDIEVPYVRWAREEKGVGEAYVWALPLRLGWASTVHRAQGMSLDAADVSLDASVFAPGAAYVAVSRVRSLGGLRLSAFVPHVVRASEAVKAFYATPYGISRAIALDAARAAAPPPAVGDAAAPPKRARVS